MEGGQQMASVPVEGEALPTFWTFDMVEDRLVEAMITMWRQPDRERGWLRVRALWPEITREADRGDYDARGGLETGGEVVIRPASLTRREVAEMEEAFGWVESLKPDDRKLVGLAIAKLAAGRREVPWVDLLRPMGLKRGRDGLRMRYGRSISTIAARLNGGNPLGCASTP